MTHFLKFTDEATAISALSAYRSEEGWITASHTHALDVVGTIYKPTGNLLTDGEGNEYQETVPLEGFHVNLVVAELPEALVAFEVFPATPARVFA